MNKITSVLLFISCFLVIFSCKKFSQKKINAEDAAVELAVVENFYVEVKSLCDEAVQGMDHFITYGSTCDTIYFDTLNATKKITVDYGPANCLCQDGRYRRGKLAFEYTGSYFDLNSTINITTVNYFVNDYQFIGIKQVKNNGDNTSNVLMNLKVEKPNSSGTIVWNTTLTRIQTSGFDTPQNITDDVFEYSGSGTGKTASGVDFSAVIKTNLVKDVLCKWFKAGLVELTTDDQITTFDYGDGTCDDQADYTRKSKTIKITLK